MSRTSMILALVASLAAGCGGFPAELDNTGIDLHPEVVINDTGEPLPERTPASYGLSEQDVARINTKAAPPIQWVTNDPASAVELVQQAVFTEYPTGPAPYCPMYNGVYDPPPPGNIQLRDDAGYCWRIYCPTGDPDPELGQNAGGFRASNLGLITMGGFSWDNRIIMVEQGPGTKVNLFVAYNASWSHGGHQIPWSGWTWTNHWLDSSDAYAISSLTCGRNY